MKNLLLLVVAGGLALLAGHLNNTGATASIPARVPTLLASFSGNTQRPVHWSADQVPQRKMDYPPVGVVTLYGNMSRPGTLILFLSGDGGWNLGVIDMAKALAQDGQTLVVGIDIVKYYKKLQSTSEACLYPAGDMENLSEFVQKELRLPDYHKPLLAGYSSGATLTYGLLCQAPASTFRGGIALGFCPDIQIHKPLCEGSGRLTMTRRKDGNGYDFTDQPAPNAPLEVLQGESDKDCLCEKTIDFFKNVSGVTVERLPKVGHGFAVTKNWLPQFKAAFARLVDAASPASGAARPASGGLRTVSAQVEPNGPSTDLPLNRTTAPADASTPMVLFISGDGGWTGFDQQICDQLAARHVPTLGLNSQSYFWKAKTPEQTTADLVPALRQHLQTWDKSKMLLVGYSFGANVAPFVYNRLPADLRARVAGVVLLSPDPKGDFEIHVAGMLGIGGGGYDVAAEIRRMQGSPVTCVSGDKEGNEMQAALHGAAQVHFEKIPGSHHYDNNAVKVASVIWKS